MDYQIQPTGTWMDKVNGNWLDPSNINYIYENYANNIRTQNAFDKSIIEDGWNKDSDGKYRKNVYTTDNRFIDFNDTFKILNPLIDSTTFLANSIKDSKENKEFNRKRNASTFNYNYNPNETGVNNVPVYYQNGGSYVDYIKKIKDLKNKLSETSNYYDKENYYLQDVSKEHYKKLIYKYQTELNNILNYPEYKQYLDDLKYYQENVKIPLPEIKLLEIKEDYPLPVRKQNGGWLDHVNDTGYTRGTETARNPYNIIPSNSITMNDVDFPILGIDNLGNEKIMFPENDYLFEGNFVYEKPLKAQNGSNKKMYNAGNLRHYKTGEFRNFNSPEEGYNALINQIDLYQSGKSTTPIRPNSSLLHMISVYAPKSDNNDPEHYANTLAERLGISVYTPISDIDKYRLADEISKFENNRTYMESDFRKTNEIKSIYPHMRNNNLFNN